MVHSTIDYPPTYTVSHCVEACWQAEGASSSAPSAASPTPPLVESRS